MPILFRDYYFVLIGCSWLPLTVPYRTLTDLEKLNFELRHAIFRVFYLRNMAIIKHETSRSIQKDVDIAIKKFRYDFMKNSTTKILLEIAFLKRNMAILPYNINIANTYHWSKLRNNP